MIVSRTPLRISFVGGGSDFRDFYQKHSGAVVSAAINKYIYVMVNRRPDGLIRVSYSKAEYVKSVDEVEHDIIREALKLVGIENSIDITYLGDVSISISGTGLSSSSALAVGVLNALYCFKNKKVSPEKLAREACRIEIDILGRPIGKQDQYAVAYGGLNYIQFNADESVRVEPIRLEKKLKSRLNNNLLLLNTGLATQSSIVLQEQKSKIQDNQELLMSVKELAGLVKNNLNKGKINLLGNFLHQNWLAKKQFASLISNNKIDQYYETALQAGASGGKILGSGGGGFLLFYCASEKNKKQVRKALTDLQEMPFQFANKGSLIVYRD